jgi:hypothetical protein
MEAISENVPTTPIHQNVVKTHLHKTLTLPDFFRFFPEVGSLGEPDGNKRCTNGSSNEKSKRSTGKDLEGGMTTSARSVAAL